MISPSRSLVLVSWHTSVAVVLIFSLLAWVVGLPGFLTRAEAAQIDTFSDTLSTSKPGTVANHTIEFTTPNGVLANGSTIEITVPTGFDMSTIGEDDIDIEDDGVDLTTAASCGAINAGISTSTQTITIEICSGGGGTIASSSVVTIEIGTNATASGAGANRIVNHASEGSYEMYVGGTMQDEGYTRLVIVETVEVTGEVDTTLTFTISGVDADQTVNADPTATFSTTTATSVAFGTVEHSTEYILAQDLSVITNAGNGFTVTVEGNGDLQAGSGATIDSFTDGTATSTPIVWAAPSAQALLPDTWGHWGLTTEDITLSDDDSFSDALYVGDFISNPREVMYATSSADGTTAHIGATRVGYKLQITAMQEAATDYTTTLTYVVTPVF